MIKIPMRCVGCQQVFFLYPSDRQHRPNWQFCSRTCRLNHPEVRFQKSVEPEPMSGCWLWIGPRQWNGDYGRFLEFEGKTAKVVLAHRWAYQHYRGPIPLGLTLDHLCRVRSCVNPWHLEPVTRAVNVLRGIGITAQALRKGACPQGHPYDIVIVERGRRPYRACRQCARARHRAWVQRRRARTASP